MFACCESVALMGSDGRVIQFGRIWSCDQRLILKSMCVPEWINRDMPLLKGSEANVQEKLDTAFLGLLLIARLKSHILRNVCVCVCVCNCLEVGQSIYFSNSQ